MKPLNIHRLARKELDKAIAYYNRQRPGLGIDFADEVGKTFDRIRYNPQLGSPYPIMNARFLLVHRFSYVIYYVETPRSIWVTAVAHGNRRPGYWSRRKLE